MKQIIDSNIIIYSASDAHLHLRKYLTSTDSCAASVSIIEVLGYHKLTEKDRHYFEAVFRLITIAEPEMKIIYDAAKLRRTYNLSVADSIIAATALGSNLELVTRNSDDFKNIKQLKLLNPFL